MHNLWLQKSRDPPPGLSGPGIPVLSIGYCPLGQGGASLDCSDSSQGPSPHVFIFSFKERWQYDTQTVTVDPKSSRHQASFPCRAGFLSHIWKGAWKPRNPPGTKAERHSKGKQGTIWLFPPPAPEPPPKRAAGAGLGVGVPPARRRDTTATLPRRLDTPAKPGHSREALVGQAPLRMRGLGRRRPRPPAQPRSGPVSEATGSRGGAGWRGPRRPAISAASCSSRPRRHGNGVTHRCRFPALLARVTPAARAPSSLTCCVFPFSPGRPPPAPRAPQAARPGVPHPSPFSAVPTARDGGEGD
ncbi:hypothetical protein H8959_012065 [Pygathrix nigripes]